MNKDKLIDVTATMLVAVFWIFMKFCLAVFLIWASWNYGIAPWLDLEHIAWHQAAWLVVLLDVLEWRIVSSYKDRKDT